MKKVALASLTLCLVGCSTLPMEQVAYEATYQALHVIDTAQTLNIRNVRGGYEKNPLLGRHPSDADIIAYMAGESVAHYLITKFMADRGAPAWLQRAWHIGSVTWSARTVHINYKIGL